MDLFHETIEVIPDLTISLNIIWKCIRIVQYTEIACQT